MKNTFARWAARCAAGLIALGASAAHADQQKHVTMTFATGARFDGTITFKDDFTRVTGVDGTLFGYAFYVYDPLASAHIDTASLQSCSNAPLTHCAYLKTATQEYPYIEFAYDYSAAPTLTFTSGVTWNGKDNWVTAKDAFVSGTITDASAVPEAQNWAMMLAGAGLAGAALRRRRRVASARASGLA